MLPTELTIRALADDSDLLDPEAFAAALGLGALIGSLPAGTGGWAYHTDVRRRFSPVMPGVELVSSLVFPLRKRQATFKDTILIGRAASTDICIPHASISKLHARVRCVDGQVLLSDAGSANGTEVDGRAIAAEVVLAQGAAIDMGDCSFVFYEPRRLYAAVAELRRSKLL